MTSINSLLSDHKNARRRTDRSAELIKESLQRYGAARSIVIDEDNRILAGNGTIEGAKAAGIKNVRIIETDGTEVIAIKRTGLSEDEKVGLALADNRTADLSEWDQAMLHSLSQEHDLSPWFEQEDLNELLAVTELEPEEGKTDPDDVPEPPTDPITKPGDIWILGNHRLLCGDSTDVLAVERLMDGEKADFCFTSPPYNSGGCKGHKTDRLGGNGFYGDGYSDSRDSEEYIDFNRQIFAAMSTIAADCFTCCYNINYNKNSPSEYLDVALAGRHHFPLVETIGWEKTMAISLQGNNMTRIFEFIIVYAKGGLKMNKGQSDCERNIWKISNIGANHDIHKACFPVELVERGVNLFALAGGIVFDPFGGSGSTLIACEKTGRQARLMELDPRYVDVIVKRWEDFTGNTAVCHPSDAHFNQEQEELF